LLVARARNEFTRRRSESSDPRKRTYKAVRINSRRSHDKKKEIYDRKAKERKFEVDEIVYLFCPAR
jgi:hypothetical protein